MRVCFAVFTLVVAGLVLGSDLAPGGEKKGAAEAISELIKDLSDEDAGIRVDAADELGRKGPAAKAAVMELIRVLKDADEHVRDAAADALGQIGAEAKAAVPAL